MPIDVKLGNHFPSFSFYSAVAHNWPQYTVTESGYLSARRENRIDKRR